MALRRSIIVTICVATVLAGGAIVFAMTGGNEIAIVGISISIIEIFPGIDVGEE